MISKRWGNPRAKVSLRRAVLRASAVGSVQNAVIKSSMETSLWTPDLLRGPVIAYKASAHLFVELGCNIVVLDCKLAYRTFLDHTHKSAGCCPPPVRGVDSSSEKQEGCQGPKKAAVSAPADDG